MHCKNYIKNTEESQTSVFLKKKVGYYEINYRFNRQRQRGNSKKSDNNQTDLFVFLLAASSTYSKQI